MEELSKCRVGEEGPPIFFLKRKEGFVVVFEWVFLCKVCGGSMVVESNVKNVRSRRKIFCFWIVLEVVRKIRLMDYFFFFVLYS